MVAIRDIDADKMQTVISKIENQTGCIFAQQEIDKIAAYTMRKCQLNGKGVPYFYILFENELHDFLMRESINLLGGMNELRKGASVKGAIPNAS